MTGNDVQHGGNTTALAAAAGCDPADILDLSINLNPQGPPDGAFECYFKAYELLNRYPEPRAASLTALLAAKFGRETIEIVAGNGSNELIALLPRALNPKRAVIVTPGYQEYLRACEVAGVPAEYFMLTESQNFALDFHALGQTIKPGDLVMLGNPNNPSGAAANKADLLRLIDDHPQTLFFIDEAFMDFMEPAASLVDTPRPNLIISRSLTKFYALPGLRMGAMFGPAEVMVKIRKLQGIWTMSAPAMEMAKFLLNLPVDYAEQSRKTTKNLRESLSKRLAGFNQLKVYPSVANYLLVESSVPDLAQTLLTRHKIAVRNCGNYPGLDARFIRIAVCDEAKREQLLTALAKVFGGKANSKRKKTPALMIQGTCSNAGKSVLTAAFCRILLQDGFNVAPFKAQNMALNSFVTHDGLEIGRAQAFQAEACRLDPDVRMNPVLLKPNSDTGSQVVLRGKPVGNLDARDFMQTRTRYWDTIKECYDSLANDYGVIVLEGAGSPAEVNLKRNDIVNMNMAAYAKANVLLAGDIDRGGLYASFAGSYATFTLKEREMLAGFVVNKFRGNRDLLADAHTYIENLTGKPVLGVLDYLKDLHLPEEDSVSHGLLYDAPKTGALDAALLVLPHIANFTDFDPLLAEPDIAIRKVRSAKDMGSPDIIILPGTKNTVGDMDWLKERGLANAVIEAYNRGAWLIGICGGLQMLGNTISDPWGIESGPADVRGLGLLPLDTVIERDKVLRQSKAVRQKDQAELKGYEIHHGRSRFENGLPLQIRDDGAILGMEAERIFASYLHGVFDDDAFRRVFINEIRINKGLVPLEGVTALYETEESLNRLADHVRERINMDYIYQLLEV